MKEELIGCICEYVSKKRPLVGSALLDLSDGLEIRFGDDGKSATICGYIGAEPYLVAHIEDDPELEAILAGRR